MLATAMRHQPSRVVELGRSLDPVPTAGAGWLPWVPGDSGGCAGSG